MSCIIIAGGIENGNLVSVGILTGDFNTKEPPNLPKTIVESSMVIHDGTILLCGGRNNKKTCLQLRHGNWKEHSTLKTERIWHSAVTTQTATYVF